MKKWLHRIFILLLCYIALVVLLPIIIRGKSDKAEIDSYLELWDEQIETHDLIALLEDPVQSGDVRLSLIDSAKESIDICYHTMKEGQYTAIFFNHLFTAADRGVKVRFIIDEMMGCMPKKTQKILASYPNIELYLYEPASLLRPWTINNRMHDKMFIIDSEIAITGGRNLADKLYGYNQKIIEPVFDRDFIIKKDGEKSIINSMDKYFALLLSLDYVKQYEAKGNSQGFRFKEGERLEATPFDLDSMELEAASIIRVSNPQGRNSKAPVIWDTLIAFMKEADDEVIIQSPYIVPTAKQLKELGQVEVPIYYITNSINTTPNFPAFSSYLVSRPSIAKTGTIREYNGDGSIHAKTILIDEDISIIGSFNLDPRSVYLDTESMYIIKSEALNTELRAIMQELDKQDSASSTWFKKASLYVLGIILFPFRMLV